jgi:zinc transporter, ZIP family
MENDSILFAFGLTMLAGLATGIGSLTAFFAKLTNRKFLSVALGFSAGVMIYVSLVEIFSKSRMALSSALGEKDGYLVAVTAFFSGIALIAIIDKFIPSVADSMVVSPASGETAKASTIYMEEQRTLLKTGIFTAIALAIHNFPEGLATFVSAINNPSLGISIASAIAIHNIPEGIAVAVPIYYATQSKRKAFLYSFLSGMAEPVGALIGYLLLQSFFNDLTFGILFALVAGIMVFIALDELLPTARQYGEHHLAIYGLVSGMAVMALSLWLFM